MRSTPLAGLLVISVMGLLVPMAPAAVAQDKDAATTVATLEDIYGPTGKRFQAAIGLLNFEKAAAGDPDPVPGYGIGVDDVVFTWKEINLVEDITECSPGGGGQTGGSCAAMRLETSNFYEGRALLTISVLDSSPTVNNCNDDFVCQGSAAACDPFVGATGCPPSVACVPDYGDPLDDFDCNDNGVPDVRVEAQTEVELAPGEFVTLDCSGAKGPVCESAEYRGTLPVSVAYDVPGVLFAAVQGSDLPTVLVTYLDNDDGTGAVCGNDVDPAAQGEVQAATAMFIDSGNVIVNSVTIVDDNGDQDGFADTGERATMAISVINKTGQTLTNVTARLSSNDPKIDCILDTSAAIDTLADGEERFTSTSGDNFVFRVADTADRQGAGLDDLDDYSAAFSVSISADQIDAATFPQQIVIDLDLDATGGGLPDGGFFEDFEVSSGLGSFTTMNLDLGIQDGDPFANSQGWRCQYSDPDWLNSNSYGQITDCFVGPAAPDVDAYYWQVHRTTDIDGGRAYSGTRSLYMGIFGPSGDEHTTPLAMVEAVRTIDPVNLSSTASPRLSIVHQVSFMDGRTVGASPGRVADRGVVQVQLADLSGNPVGDWIKLEPFQNLYDQQAEANYTNCLFDPVDDGTTEDDFFDPSDPDRRLGPSSTCFPESVFAHVGNTFDPFNGDVGGTNGGLTPEGPALQGSLGVGSWIESKFTLDRFRGRRLRLRFLNSSLKVGTFANYEQLFASNPDPGDDGWWIDAVNVAGTIDTPATVTTDDSAPPGTPSCAMSGCTVVTPDLELTPPGPLPVPGQAVTLDASGSTADACLDGTLQYRFLKDGSQLLRDWTDNPLYIDVVLQDSDYTLSVRCSSLPGCMASTVQTAPVENDEDVIGPGGTDIAWVLNAQSRTISVVDAGNATLGGTIAIPGDTPRALEFSTAVGHVGEQAYVTQGPVLTQIDTPLAQVIGSFNFEVLLGYFDVRLKGIAAARPQTFTAGVKSYLHIAADVEVNFGDGLQPWFFVLDQDRFFDGSPFAVADEGALGLPGVAGDPTVLSWVFGNQLQRVWYTTAEPGVAVHTRLVASDFDADWAPVAGSTVSIASATASEANLVVGTAPPGRELAYLPGGESGSVTQLIPRAGQVGTLCNIGGGNDIREIAVTGPGRNSFEIWVLDRNGELQLFEENGTVCDTHTLNVGSKPVALDTLGRFEYQQLFVADEASDTLRIVTQSAEGAPLQQQTVFLNPPMGGHKPVDVRVKPTTTATCNVEDSVLFTSSGAADPMAIQWDSIGCGGATPFTIWFHEEEGGGFRTAHNDWIDLGQTGDESGLGSDAGNYIIGSDDRR